MLKTITSGIVIATTALTIGCSKPEQPDTSTGKLRNLESAHRHYVNDVEKARVVLWSELDSAETEADIQRIWDYGFTAIETADRKYRRRIRDVR